MPTSAASPGGSAPAASSVVTAPEAAPSVKPAGTAEPPKMSDFSGADTRSDDEDQELEYYGAQVLMIDHPSGWIGVLYYPDDSDEGQKLAFRAEPDVTDIKDVLNREVEFNAIEVGATLDIFTNRENGREEVYEIVTRSISADLE